MDQKNDEDELPSRQPCIYRIKSPQGWEIEVGSEKGHQYALDWFQRLSALGGSPAALNSPRFEPQLGESYVRPQGSDVLLSQWLDEYMEVYLPASSNLNAKGRTEAKASIELFITIIGDKPLGAITTRDGQAFVATLRKWPNHASKKSEFRDLTSAADILRVAKETRAVTISPVTVINRTNYVQRFFAWLKARHEIHFDPFEGTLLPDATPRLTRLPFSPQDIQTIFDREHRKWAETPHQFWAPLIAFYTGARVREIGQLYLDDIEYIQDVWVMHVAERFPGQQVKTDGSQRAIPLRKELIDLGFLDYVEDVRAHGAKLLFPYTTWTNGDAGRPIARPFNETYLRVVCGILEPEKSFHCFRHLFSTQAERSGLTDGRISQLTGHKLDNVSALRKNYIQAATLCQRHKDIHQIELPSLNLDRYVPGQFSRHLALGATKQHKAEVQGEADSGESAQ